MERRASDSESVRKLTMEESIIYFEKSTLTLKMTKFTRDAYCSSYFMFQKKVCGGGISGLLYNYGKFHWLSFCLLFTPTYQFGSRQSAYAYDFLHVVSACRDPWVVHSEDTGRKQPIKVIQYLVNSWNETEVHLLN